MQFDIAAEFPPTAMIGEQDAADVLGVPPGTVRAYLTGRNEPPVATYHGRPLWLADTVQDMVAA